MELEAAMRESAKDLGLVLQFEAVKAFMEGKGYVCCSLAVAAV